MSLLFTDDPTPVPFADPHGNVPTLQSARAGDRLHLRLTFPDRVANESFPGALSTADALRWLTEWYQNPRADART